MSKHCIVVTSIAPPTDAMRALAEGAVASGIALICVGDKKSPALYDLEGVEFLSLEAQLDSGYQLAHALPTGHYSRKNLGYLLAIEGGALRMSETDDDNAPLPAFWQEREPEVAGRLLAQAGWHNPYRHFSDAMVWPRGLPLEGIHEAAAVAAQQSPSGRAYCPVQQDLANGDTDVDAIYRMTRGDLVEFEDRGPIILCEGAWTPFNSQSTHWWQEAFELLYLPSFCSFRMTDIWRSFVTQACLWPCGWRLAYNGPSMVQDRNPHNLLHDFKEEIPGYLHNNEIIRRFAALDMKPGPTAIHANLHRCYSTLIDMGVVDARELELLEHWFDGIDQARGKCRA